MSTNIKLLIALLLGAAIGALVMKKMSPNGPLANPTDETEYGITSPITWDAAKEMVQHPIVDSLNAASMKCYSFHRESNSYIEATFGSIHSIYFIGLLLLFSLAHTI